MVLTPEFWLQTSVYLIGGTSAVVAIAFRIGQIEGRFVTKEMLNEKVKERNHEISRVYERFDEFKAHAENIYVRKDMCGQMHIASKDELKRIDDEYKAFRHEIRNAVQHLTDKIDELRSIILGK